MLEAVDIHTNISAPGLPDFEPVWTAAADPLTHSLRVLLFALETFGSERIVLGSDYPFKRDLLRLPVAASA